MSYSTRNRRPVSRSKTCLALALLLGLGASVALWGASQSLDVPKPSEANDPVADATNSVFELRFDEYNTGGSAFLVGRKELPGGRFQYNALTAAHVVEDVIQTMALEIEPSYMAHISFNSWDKGRIEYSINYKFGWVIPNYDWASITFILDDKLPCLRLGTEEDLLKLSPTDNVYVMGSEGLNGVVIHKTNIAALSNQWPTPDDDQFDPSNIPYAFFRLPEAYFRIGRRIIGGISGGPVINSDGVVIGMVTGYWGNISVALKTSIIADQTSAFDLLRVEK